MRESNSSVCMAIRDRLLANTSKQTTSLADTGVAAPIGMAYGHVISSSGNEEHQEKHFYRGDCDGNANIT